MNIRSEYLELCSQYLDERIHNTLRIIVEDLFTRKTLAGVNLDPHSDSPALVCPDVTLHIMGYLRGRDLVNFAKVNREMYSLAANLVTSGTQCKISSYKYGRRTIYVISAFGMTLRTYNAENFTANSTAEALGKLITGIISDRESNQDEQYILHIVPPYKIMSDKFFAKFCSSCGKLCNLAEFGIDKSYDMSIDCYDCSKCCTGKTTNLRVTMHSPNLPNYTILVSYHSLEKLEICAKEAPITLRFLAAIAKHHGWNYNC